MPRLVVAESVEAAEAVLNITWAGQNGDLPNPIAFDAPDAAVRRWAAEAVSSGVPGITADRTVNFQDFVVERFTATAGLPHRVVLRPKTPFG